MRKVHTARPIIVAVRELDRSARPLLRKAALLAKLHGSPVRLVNVLALPQGSLLRAGANVRQAAVGVLNDRRNALMKLAAGPELRGVKTSVSVCTDYPAADALVGEVLKHRARLLLAQSHRHGRFARVWLSNTDWDLIRNCPCPLWLSKSNRFSAGGVVVAAVDPLHTHAKPAALDRIIVKHALEAAGGQRKRVLLCHSYSLPQPVAMDSPVEAYWLAMSEQERQAYEAMLEKQIDRLRARHGIPSKNTVIAPGDPGFQLPRIAKKHAASLVVMGAVSRRGLRRIFIGHTAERVIDELRCDVLIVKPRGFKTPAVRRARDQMRSLVR